MFFYHGIILSNLELSGRVAAVFASGVEMSGASTGRQFNIQAFGLAPIARFAF